MFSISQAKISLIFLFCFSNIVVSSISIHAQGTIANSQSEAEKQRLQCPIPQNYDKADNTQEYQQLMTGVLSNNPIVSAKYSAHKLRVLRAISEGNPDDADNQSNTHLQNKPPISLTVFDYTINKTLFFIVDGSTGKVLRAHTLYGRPQPSQEEIDAAGEIVKADPAFSSFLQNNAKITGGFIVDGPAKTPEDHRYMQMRIVTADQHSTKKVVIVDLSTDTVVSK